MKKSHLIIAGLIVVVGGLFAWSSVQPGQLDAFAQCLEEKDTTFYGAFWCPHCQEQKALFGNSEKKLPYVECSTPDRNGVLPVCEDAEIESYPTWEFADGERVLGVLTPEQLSERTGCLLP